MTVCLHLNYSLFYVFIHILSLVVCIQLYLKRTDTGNCKMGCPVHLPVSMQM